MPNCKLCGKQVRAGAVMHSACWERAAERFAQTFCDDYCRWPRECRDEDSLHEFHCDGCIMNRLAGLGM